MIDWIVLFAAGIAGAVAGIIIGGVTSSCAREVLEEWRETRAFLRERERELREELRSWRAEKRAIAVPALDQAFSAADEIHREATRLMREVQRPNPQVTDLLGERSDRDAPILTDALQRLDEAAVVIQREIRAPEIVSAVTVLHDAHDILDRDRQILDWSADARYERMRARAPLLQHIALEAQQTQGAVLAYKTNLEAPVL